VKQNSKKNLLNHSEAKVKLLGDYIKKYLSVICNDGYTEKIKIYDIFCGEGLYKNKGKGSPLVLLNAINEVVETQRNKKNIPKIECFFNDKENKKIENLKVEISKNKDFNNNCKISYTSNDYKDIVNPLINDIKGLKKEKAFIFIDPYGYKQIKAKQINQLMKSRNAEVLLWLPIQQMYRFSEKGTPEALYDFLEELDINEGEKTIKDNVWKFIKQLNDGFQKSIGDNFFVDYFSIEKDKNTVYCLYFFTSHIRGLEKMLETKWAIDEEYGRGWDCSGNNPSLLIYFEKGIFAQTFNRSIKEIGY